jgi:Ni/Co efflux regulator RcnB
MKRFLTAATALALIAGMAGPSFAQPGHDDHNDNHRPAMQGPAMHAPDNHGPDNHGPSHADWRKGGHIGRDDWNRGQRVDYRTHHLKAPPRGYEWRQVDGNYVLAAAATGLIASIILSSH